MEAWIDRIIRDKLKVREFRDLSTELEHSRLEPPPCVSDEENNKPPEDQLSSRHADDRSDSCPSSEASSDEETDTNRGSDEGERSDRESASQETDLSPRLLFEPHCEDRHLSGLLKNIFDAADEESEGFLSHSEVSDLLHASPLGLTAWDLRLLLSTATENDMGMIYYAPFVEDASAVITTLRQRREAYRQRTSGDTVSVTEETIDLCFGEEFEETGRLLRECFEAADPKDSGTLPRIDFGECLNSKPDRCSPQEHSLLMQMVQEDEEMGYVAYADFVPLFKLLRREAFHNAVVETDVKVLRQHLLHVMIKAGLTNDMVLSAWDIRYVLLQATQICLSRMQIHVLLCITETNSSGLVDCGYFLKLACTVIPLMFDKEKLRSTAQQIAKERADAAERAEMEELQGLTGGTMRSLKTTVRQNQLQDEEEHEEDKGAAPERDTVEKSLIHLFNIMDDKHRGTLDAGLVVMALKQSHENEQRYNDVVAQCQLSDAELRGLIAEAALDETDKVRYVEHIKTWIPVLFELRKSRVYEPILNAHWKNLVDLTEYEADDPIEGYLSQELTLS
eukprot:GHVQ01024609.1.p1 GENE.GHVQ01024609.1~~GHVQ01024609.1.p1  ORF type:complete len:627 (+),score=108.99 GHVQ01024609.1:190-1881(+)